MEGPRFGKSACLVKNGRFKKCYLLVVCNGGLWYLGPLAISTSFPVRMTKSHVWYLLSKTLAAHSNTVVSMFFSMILCDPIPYVIPIFYCPLLYQMKQVQANWTSDDTHISFSSATFTSGGKKHMGLSENSKTLFWKFRRWALHSL